MIVVEWLARHYRIILCAAMGTLFALIVTGIRYICTQYKLSKEIDDFVDARRKSKKVKMDDYILTDYDDSQNLHTV